jgi:hypothetical protein
MKKYYDEIDDCIYTEDEIRERFYEIKADPSIEIPEDNFSDYLHDCLSKNGALTEIK